MIKKLRHICRPSLLSLVFLAGLPLAVGLSKDLWINPQLPLIKGEAQLAFEKNWDEKISFRNAALATWGVIQYALFHEGRKGVLAGREGWLYSSEDFDPHPQAVIETERKIALITRIQQQLKAQKIGLIVAVIPDKSRLYPEYLGTYQRPAYTALRYEAFVARLQQAGLTAPNLYTALLADKQARHGADDLFLRTDTHWTPRGAALAATVLAQSAPHFKGSLSYKTALAGSAVHKGDLTKFVPLGAWDSALGLPPDDLPQVKTESSTSTAPATADDLLGDVAIAGALVGTSYSADARWNFIGALRQAFGQDFINVAAEGKGPFLPMLSYLDSAAFKASPPQFIVWDIPERFIEVSYTLSPSPLTKDLP